MIKAILEFGLTRSAIVVLGLLVFCAAGLVAFTRLNIEAYPNPGAGHSRDHRAGSRPLRRGDGKILHDTDGGRALSDARRGQYPLDVVLWFVVRPRHLQIRHRLLLRADSKPRSACSRMSRCRAIWLPTIQASSLVGEIYRYQLVGPPHFGLTNLRTLQDYVVTRRLLTIPGVAQINSWGGTTKQFNVDADLEKLEAYNITIPQLITAIGNANINVGGREISIGQQSVNIRGIGLIDSGGADDVTNGYHVEDIENIVLTQSGGLPIQIKDVAKVSVGYVPRLGIAGRDHDDDVVAAIVVMRRTEHTNDIIPQGAGRGRQAQQRRQPAAGRQDRSFLRPQFAGGVTTHTVLHNLIFGCLLVFLIQWIFLGDLRSAIIVSANIPFALFFAIIILVLQRRGRQPVVARRGRFRHHRRFCRDHDGEHLPQFPIAGGGIGRLCCSSCPKGYWGPIPLDERSRMAQCDAVDGASAHDLCSALQVDKAVFFTAAITVTAFVPLFTMQGVEGQIFGPMARTYGYALAGALLATFTVTPVLARCCFPRKSRRSRRVIVRGLRATYTPVLRWALASLRTAVADRRRLSRVEHACCVAAWQRISAGARGGQFLDQGRATADDLA